MDAGVDAVGGPPDSSGELEIVVTPATVALEEGGTPGRFSVRLSQAPTASVTLTVASSDDELVPVAPTTLTFTTANFATAQDVGLGAEDDADLDDETITVTVSGEGLESRTVTVTVTDDDAQAILVEPTSLDVTEGETGSIGVTLAYQPTANVTVTVASADVTGATVSPATLTFTPGNYATPQAVTVTGVQDDDVLDDSVAVSVASSGLTSVAVAVTVVDDDALNISVTPGSLTLTEGGVTGSIGVTLTQAPAADVTVNVATSDAGAAAISTTALTFTPANYAVAQNVVVTPAQDGDVQAENVTITLSATGLTDRTVDVTVADDDVQAIVVSANTVTVAEGATTTFTAALQFNPGTDVTVAVASSDLSTIGGSPITLVFTAANYAVPQTVTVTGVQDVDLTNETGTLTLQALGIGPSVVNVTVTDNDTQAIVPTPSPATVTEGGMTALNVRLAFQPAANVTVTLATSDATSVALSGATLTFTPANYATTQSINLMGVNDADLVNDGAQITLTSPGLTTATVTVTVQDDDAQVIIANPANVPLTEGGASANVMVSLSFMPAADVTVTVVSSDPGAVTALPASLTFTTANYNVAQAVALAPLTDADARDENVTVTLSAAGIPDNVVTVSVDDDDTQALVVTPLSVAVTEQGATSTFTVAFAAEPNDTRTVMLTSNDPGSVATSVPSLTFTTLDWNVPQTVTVSGVADPDLSDELTSITLSAAGSSAANVNVNVTVTDDDGQNLVVAPDTVNVTEDTPSGDDQFTVSLAFQPAGTVSVSVTSNAPTSAAVSSGTLTFTPANYNVPQLVSVTGVSDANQTNTTTTIDVVSVGLTTQVVNVNVIDDDEQSIIVEPAIVGAGENTSETFTVRLAFEPLGGSETLTLASQAPTEVAIDLTSLAFVTADYATPRVVTVSPQEDADVINEDVTIDLTSNRVSTPANFVLVEVTDNDSQQIIRDPAQFTIYEDNEGNAGQVAVHLQQDPSGTIDVITNSLDAGAANVTSGVTLSFTSGNYLTDQFVTVTAMSDDDLADESVQVHHNATGMPTRVTTVLVEDDDNQAIQVAPGTVSVLEEGTSTFTVRLAHQPSGNRSITVSSSNAMIATALPATLVFTSANWNVEQTVTVTGSADGNLDPDSTTLSVDMLGGLVAPEGAAPVVVNVNVTDDDEQEIIVTAVDTRLQEGGPGRTYTVHLGFPPALANGGVDVVNVFSLGEYLTTNLDGGLFFTTGNYDDPQSVTVFAPEDADELSREDTMRHVISAYPYTPTTDQVFGITDDEITIIAEATFTELNDGTEFTKRSNVIANPAGLLAVTGLNAAGDTAGASVSRDLTGFAMANGGAAYADPGADLSPIFSVEHDGTNFGFFSTEGSVVRFTRLAANLAAVVVTSTFAGRDVWSTWNGSVYGVIARHATNNNLFFRSLNPTTGTFGAAIQVTTASPTVHEHANIHAIGSGWVTIYSAAVEVRCVVQAANGAPSINVALGSYPSGGAYVSSIYNAASNRIVTVHVDPTSGLFVNEIDPGNCQVTGSRRVRGTDNYITVPSIAHNGDEYVVAYDVVTAGGNQVGVLRSSGNTSSVAEDLDDLIAGAQRPTIVWAGDRWVVRAALDGGGIHMVVGSLQSHCVNGVQDSDETGPDCGGPTCGFCPVEYSFTDTTADDVTTTSLIDFFNTLPGALGPDSWMYVEFSVPNGGWSVDDSITKCMRGADWYADNYVAFATTGFNDCHPNPERWYQLPGDPTWYGGDTSCINSSFGHDSWNDSTSPYLFAPDDGYQQDRISINPADGGSCEIVQPGWACSDDRGWRAVVRVGGSRASVCPGNFVFTGGGGS